MSSVTTRTGRRVVPTPAAAAAAAAGSGSGGTGNSNSPAPSTVSTPTPSASKPGTRNTRGIKSEDTTTPKDPAQKPSSSAKDSTTTADPQKRRGGLRATRCSSGSAEESVEKSTSTSANSPPTKKLKATPTTPTKTVPEPKKAVKKEAPAESTPSIEATVELALSKMFEETSPEKEQTVITVSVPEHPVENPSLSDKPKDESPETVVVIAEAMDPAEIETQAMEVDVEANTQIVEQIEPEIVHEVKMYEPADTSDEQQNNAVESILPDDTIGETEATVENSDVGEIIMENEDVDKKIEAFPSWNEQGCIVCNVDIAIDDPTNVSRNHDKVKDFFLEFFSIGDQISMEGENVFPFCQKCAEDMESLLGINHKIEFMHKQFNKVRDSLAKKAIKTFLVRTKPSCLEEDAKTESYGFLDDEQKKSYKEQMFNLWKSRYELVQPGPKTPIMIRSMDSRGRVTVVRLNSQGQPIPEKFGNMKRFSGSDIPIGGMGRTVNGEEDSEGNGDGTTSLDIYQCKECPKSFSAKAMLAYHSRIHSGELPFECDLCGKAFSVPHYLMTHMRSHTGEKPYKCNECGKGFAQRGGLVTHALVHTGAKPYSCQVCGKSFRQKYHLTQHNLIHSGVKPFSCDLCGKCFNVKMNLREHMRRHTGDRPYKCPYCTSIGFFRKKMLKDHIVKAHPQRPMPVELMAAEPSETSREPVHIHLSADSNDSSHSADNDEILDSILPDNPLEEEAVK